MYILVPHVKERFVDDAEHVLEARKKQLRIGVS